MPFVIFGLPRCRTYWLSRFLTYGGWTCSHEEIIRFRSYDDIKSWLSLPNTGTAETNAAQWWRTLRELAPDTRVVIVRRPVDEVVASMMKMKSVKWDEDRLVATMTKMSAKLDQVEKRWPGALAVSFDELKTEETCRRVFEHCLPFPHDHAWWERIAPINLQINMASLFHYMNAHAPQLDNLAAIVRQKTLGKIQTRPIIEPDGFTIQVEDFDKWRSDPTLRDLSHDHCISVGEHPDNMAKKNFALMKAAADDGMFQVVTARCNGRLFGYLTTFYGPCLENIGMRTGVHTLFFVDKSAPRIGLKLQRFALASLKGKIDELYLRAGPRGDGPRTSAIYRRLGAIPDGEMFKITLADKTV